MNEQPKAGKTAGDRDDGLDAARRLVFEPDKVRQARIRRARSLTAWLILGGLAVVLVWLSTFRPRPPRQTGDDESTSVVRVVSDARYSSSAERSPPPEAGRSEAKSRTEASAAEHRSQTPAEAAADIGHLAESSLGRWGRVVGVTLAQGVGPSRALDMLDELAALRTQLDSADIEVAEARVRSTEIGKASRAGNGNAYKLSVLFVTSEKVVEELDKQAEEVRDYLESVRAALRAASVGEDDEFEVKVNVANGHLARADRRRRHIDRRLRSLTQVAKEVGG